MVIELLGGPLNGVIHEVWAIYSHLASPCLMKASCTGTTYWRMALRSTIARKR